MTNNRLYKTLPGLWCLLLCSVLSIALPAQDVNVDSLQQLIENAPDKPTKVRETTTLANVITSGQPIVAKQSLLEILPLAQSLEDDILVDVYYFLGRAYEAKTLLDTADLNVSQVTYAVGISSPGYFSRIFMKEFGYPPSETHKL